MTVQKIIAKTPSSLQVTDNVIIVKDVHIQQAVQDLIDTLEHQQSELDKTHPGKGAGAGLASNQIEYPYRATSDTDTTPAKGYYPKNFKIPHIYVVSIRPERAHAEDCHPLPTTAYINSAIIPTADSQTNLIEGCLSVTGITGFNVPRFTHVNVTAMDRDGKELKFAAQGFLARVHQHESDHCRGEEYLNAMDLSQEDIEAALQWVQDNPAPKEGAWILQDKLQCTSDKPDLTALSVWLNNQLHVFSLQQTSSR